jgi:hypothetical protein
MIGTVADLQQLGNRQGCDCLVSREQPPRPIGDDPRALSPSVAACWANRAVAIS